MKKSKTNTTEILRQKAEDLAKNKPTKIAPQLTVAEAQKLIHELEVHHIELELQNEQLILAKETAEAATQKAIELYDFAPSGYYTLAKDGEIIDLNLTGAKMLDHNRLYLKKKRLGVFIDTGSRSDFSHFLTRVFESRTTQSCEISLSVNENSSNYIYLTGLIADNGTYCFITGVDITERKRAEEKFAQQQKFLEIITGATPDIVYLYDPKQQRHIFINREIESMLGYSSKEIQETGAEILLKSIHPEDVQKVVDHINYLASAQDNFFHKLEYRIIGKDGNYLWFYIREQVFLRNKEGQPEILFGICQNVTERKNAEEEINKSKELLEQLYKHINEVREEERTSIAREIHDDLGQSLAGLKIDLIDMKENIGDTRNSKQKLTKAISLVSDTIKSVQKLASQLRPQTLDLGLASAIEWQANEFKRRTGIKCNLELEEIEDLEGNIPISLFRIFQASLTNIMLHSKATSISVKLALRDEMLKLSVIDNGIGITPEQIISTKSFGLIGMRERANHINGKFEIHSDVSKGTEIKVTVPVNRK